ncbi:MAG: putative fructose 1,6-bisphosphatase [Candidatus Scalindua rubra]|uniref:fructose-bisphosphatase n=1 Tax=Candidatus Scalindua rubra TaxID=1872076 RepID=A0A1E3XCC9_9BACT|nr:MAG: putative fructose 1,6-bisphosphatase [Candidatus Scalindua rubra]
MNKIIKGEQVKDKHTFIKDNSFDSKRIDDPYILEAYIPEGFNLKTSEKGLQLTNRNELRHAVGFVAARSLRYFSTNGEGFNIFRTRDMAVWWLRHIYNSFNWWKAYVVNAEGERKDMPMLYIGERFGSATTHKDNEADIVLSAFENDQCMISQESEGGVIFAAGYSERGGLFNSPDMYGIKTIVGNNYKGVGVNVTQSIRMNLKLMAEHTLKNRNKESTLQSINDEIKKMKIVVLDRPRHKKLIETINSLGAKVILVKEDDLTPTFAVMRNEVDLIIGVGGIPEALLSAIIVEKLGGEMTLRILPIEVAQDDRLLRTLGSQILFRKNEVDILKNFKIVRPGTEKEGEIPWNRILTSKDLAKGKDTVFTASIIKKTPWIRFPDGEEVPGVNIHPETGDIKVHVVRIANNNVEVVPVVYKTAIGKFLKQYIDDKDANGEASVSILIQLGKAYSEFGLFQQARDCIQKAKICNGISNDLIQRCNSVYEYISGLDFLTKKSLQTPKEIIEHFEKSGHLDKEEKEGLRPRRMSKRFYEYLGDKNYHNQLYEEAIINYRKALEYSPHELKLHRKVNSIQMKDIVKEYFNRIDKRYQDLNYKESKEQERHKLGIALEVFYDNKRQLSFSCRNPWLIFFRRTVLHGETPSYKLAVLVKLLRLYKKLNRASEDELNLFLNTEFGMSGEEIDIILNYRRMNKKFHSVGELYFVKGLSSESLSKLLFPYVRIESHNELEDSEIPLSISLVEAVERRYKNILEELKEGFKEEAQEHSYAVAEAYHYVGLALYDVGDDEGSKIQYEMAITRFSEIIEKFTGITPVNAEYRIGNLYEELALLFEKEQADYYDKAIEAYTNIIDEQKSNKLFGLIRGLTAIRTWQAKERVNYIERELHLVES